MECEHSQLEDRMCFSHLCDPPVECPDCHQLVEVIWDESWDGEEEHGWFELRVVSPGD